MTNPPYPQCRECGLYKQATQLVWGEGRLGTTVFIGEAPGKDEDLQGRPFVGRSGDLLNQLLGDIGLLRSEICIMNTIKCRPPQNRIEDRYVSCCEEFLGADLARCRPRVVVTLGATASKWIQQRSQCEALAGYRTEISAIQGAAYEIHTIIGTMIWVPMYHPAAALRDPDKVEALKASFGVLHDVLTRMGKLPAVP